MHRIRTALYSIALATTLAACTEKPEEVVEAAPVFEPVKNLLLICIDTVRADTFYQLGDLQNDRLNDWQHSAMVFSQADSPAPWTVPALGSVFTGLWPVQHGAGLLPGVKKISIAESPPATILPKTPTLAQKAKRSGFSTTVISSSGWTFERKNGAGINGGFENFHKFAPSLQTLGDVYWKPMVDKWTELVDAQAPEQRAVNFVHFIEAHNWHVVSEPELDERIASFTPTQLGHYRQTAPEKACEDEQSLYCKRYLVYAHAVGVLRDAVADMLDTLKANGQLENTAVVLFSDHGEEFNDHAGDGRAPSKYRKLTYFGHGQSLYQELIHVPLVVWHPDHAAAVIDTPVSLMDIAPSAAQWLGIDFKPANGQGKLLHEQADAGTDRVLFASHISEGEKQLSARQGSSKAVWYVASDRTEYYDLAQDPLETQSMPSNDKVLKFDGLFLEYEQLKPADKSKSASFSDEQVKRLQSIGYLQGVDNEEAGK